jgi:hypothetical protein
MAAYGFSIHWALALGKRTNNADSVQHTVKMLHRLRW